jgi:hypothetical protein
VHNWGVGCIYNFHFKKKTRFFFFFFFGDKICWFLLIKIWESFGVFFQCKLWLQSAKFSAEYWHLFISQNSKLKKKKPPRGCSSYFILFYFIPKSDITLHSHVLLFQHKVISFLAICFFFFSFFCVFFLNWKIWKKSFFSV